jgi:hypothetical protein
VVAVLVEVVIVVAEERHEEKVHLRPIEEPVVLGQLMVDR